jgi:hypothetical protein
MYGHKSGSELRMQIIVSLILFTLPKNGWQPYFTVETKEREIKEGLFEPITKHVAISN